MMECHISFRRLKLAYVGVCIVAAIGSVIWGVYIYSLDEDLTRIDVKSFNQDKGSIYPSISLFFYSPSVNEKFGEKFGKVRNGITPTMYKMFLQGDVWNETLMDIDYNDVTLNIMDYFRGYDIEYSDRSVVSYNINNINNTIWKPPYSNGNSSIGKAFTVDIPFQSNKKVRTVDIKLTTNIFANEIRPDQITPTHGFDGFGVYFNYPKQLWSTKHFRKLNWPVRAENSSKSYLMLFELQNIKVMQNRDRAKEPCINIISDLDHMHFKEVFKRLPCKPPYLNPDFNLSSCKSKEEMKECHNIVLNLDTLETLEYPPCRSLGRVEFQYLEYDMEESEKQPYFTLRIVYVDLKYTEILRVRSFDFHMLFGTIGGYIGILIGYALLDVPDLLAKLVVMIRKNRETTDLENKEDGEERCLEEGNDCRIVRFEEQDNQVEQIV